MKTWNRWNLTSTPIVSGICIAVLAGCGGGGHSHDGLSAYEEGYADGFADDSIYDAGYDDSWFTRGTGPILYSGDTIPFIDDFNYDAGFFDGQFDAYNDGYFVAYSYTFVIGFSEGYDNGFWPDFLDFLAADAHPEFLHGGFSDGYHDGFSEGRVFGAFDFEAGLPFDWLDAFLDWRSGTDLFFEEVGVGTGVFGPVVLYEYGANPHLIKDQRDGARERVRQGIVLRTDGRAKQLLDIARGLNEDQALRLDVLPPFSLRSDRPLALVETWLERIDAVNTFAKTSAPAPSARAGGRRFVSEPDDT